MTQFPPSTARIPEMTNRPKSQRPPAPSPARRGKNATRTLPQPAQVGRMQAPPAVDVDDEIAAAVEEQLAAQRAELTAKLLAEREERRRLEEAEAATRAAESAEFSPAELAKLQRMLTAAGVRLVPATAQAPTTAKRARTSVPVSASEAFEIDDSDGLDVPDADYSDTERVQVELIALLDLLGVVRVRDVQEHVRREDGSVMSPSNVRYHMKKLANRGVVKKAEERYKLPGLGYRTRDVWSRDPQLLLEILEGKKIVRQ